MSHENYLRNRREGFLRPLFRFLERRTRWRGTPSELVDAIGQVCVEYGDGGPEAAGIGRELESYQQQIKDAGWTFEFGRTKNARWIELRRE